jgi:hypothetical protein
LIVTIAIMTRRRILMALQACPTGWAAASSQLSNEPGLASRSRDIVFGMVLTSSQVGS